MLRRDVAISVRDDAGTLVAALAGELDLGAAGRVGATLNDAMRGGSGPVVLDLTELRFVDSSGMALLLNVVRRLERRDRPCAIALPPGPARRSIELARVDRLLPLVADVAAALSAARSASGRRQPA